MNYYEQCEEVGNKLFCKWAEQVKPFVHMERQPLLSRIDWKCISTKGNKINCELKVRDNLDYPTIFLELGKYDILMKEWREQGIIPWYINMKDDTVLVFDLRYVKPLRQKAVKIWSHPDHCYKEVIRWELPTNKAFKFINGTLERH